jgi:hypothetical protein
MKGGIIYALIGLLPLAAAVAQTKPGSDARKVSLPPDFKLAESGEYSTWGIVFSYAGDTTKAASPEVQLPAHSPYSGESGGFDPGTARELVVTRTGGVRQLQVTGINGKHYEQWSDGQRNFWVDSTGAVSVIRPSSSLLVGETNLNSLLDRYLRFSRNIFADTEWVGERTCRGVESVEGLRCWYFTDGNRRAWVGQESRAIVCWQGGGETRHYRRLPDPKEQLKFPATIQKALEEGRKHEAAITRPIPRNR